MTDMVFRPRFHDVDSEREVVLEEIAMVDDNPSDLVHDLATEAVFGDHPLGRPVIGSADVIASVSKRALQAYHRGAYVGGNIVVAAAGNVEHGDFSTYWETRRAGDETAQARAEARAARGTSALPVPAKGHRAVPRLPRGAGISRVDERRYASTLLDAIIGGSASSRLFQEIREKRGMAYSVYTYGSQFVDSGQIGLYLGTREENLGRVYGDRRHGAPRRRGGKPPVG